MSRRKSGGIDIGSILPWGIAAVGAYWLYSNWSTLSTAAVNAVSGIFPAAAPVTPTTGGIIAIPASAQQVSDLAAQANIARQEAADAVATGNPNAAILQAQASALTSAAAVAQVSAPTAPAGMQGLNRRYFRRRIA